MACLFVGNLPLTTTELELSVAFRGLGYQVQRSQVIRNGISGESLGFGFVELSPAEDQDKAIEDFRGTRIGGRTVRVYRMNPVATHVSGRRISAGNLATENTDKSGARPGARFIPPSVLRGKESQDCAA